METTDQSPFSEITILPDGRIYVFGATRPLLEILESMDGQDERVGRLLRALRENERLMHADPEAVTTGEVRSFVKEVRSP